MPDIQLKEKIRDAILESAISSMTSKKGITCQIRLEETMDAIMKVIVAAQPIPYIPKS